MASVTVGTEIEAAAIVARVETSLRNMIPFFQKLEEASGALDVAEREVWDKRFGIGLRHSKRTIEMRRDREDYYGWPKDARATSSSPYFEWTGSLRQAASRWTTLAPDRAVIDPDKNYEGPLEGVVPNPFSDIVASVVDDDSRIWPDQILGKRIERDLTTYLLNRLEGRAVGS